MTWKEPKRGELVTCETVAAIVLHARRITDREVSVRLARCTADRVLRRCQHVTVD